MLMKGDLVRASGDIIRPRTLEELGIDWCRTSLNCRAFSEMHRGSTAITDAKCAMCAISKDRIAFGKTAGDTALSG